MCSKKDAKGERLSSCVSLWNLVVNFFVAGQWHMMWSSSPSTDLPVARQCGHTLS